MEWEKGAEQLGLHPEKLEAACSAINREIAAGTMPGAVLGVIHKGRHWIYASGYANPDRGELGLADEDTLYDMASLTKVTVTLPLILRLMDEGRITLGTPVMKWLPQFGRGGREEITIGQLLTHTSGLPALIRLYEHEWDREQMWDAVFEAPLRHSPGQEVLYSDIGYILLGRIVEEVLGIPLDEAARTRIFEPLGMSRAGFNPPADAGWKYAATEYNEAAGGHLSGVVHDENARVLGGISGHAGLFATVKDLIPYAQMWLQEGAVPTEGSCGPGMAHRRILSRAAVRTALLHHMPGCSGGRRGLGWVLKGDKLDASGDWMSSGCYGHTGFTGTSMWMDPEYDLGVILLTNRVYSGRNTSVAQLRVQVHNALVASVTMG